MQPIVDPFPLSPWIPGPFSLIAYAFAVAVITAILLFVSSWLGEKKPNPEKLRPYESGVIPTGTARLRFPVPFYLVAIFFLIFDVEGAFIFAWAVSAESLGWTGFLEITFFIFVLIVGLFYVWKKGGLDWRPQRTRK
ncbi:MAG: NADH-quinone oxidoreductase subunit A [Desulfobacterales bacterium]|nr:NADH-quinone oxidoreductase subunit A [Desulfobacterales bacterium]